MMRDEAKLPTRLSPDGLLIGYSLDEERHRPVMGFEFGDAIEDEDPDNELLEPILHTGDGHLITLARTGAGKGVGCIIPALLRYPGPVIVIDPKGENYQVTARRRREMGQKVLLLDPFGVTGEESGALNPLDLIDPRSPEAIDSAAQLAELIVTKQHKLDPFWDSRAHSLITTMLLFIASARPPVLRNLQEMHYLLNQTSEDMDFTFKEILKNPLPAVRQGGAIKSTAEAKVWASILSTAQSHTDFLRSAGAQATLGRSTIDLQAITSGDPISIYVVVPPEKLESHGKLLRLWIGVMMAAITQRSRRPDLPTLFILDEAAQLGPLKQLRQAITLLRGYGLRTWSFWQDLSQLQMLYPDDWKTMINNCEVLQAFGFANARVARDGAELTGYEDWRVLQDLEFPEMVLAIAGDKPVIARKPNYLEDPAFAGQFEDNLFYSNAPQQRRETRAPAPPAKRGSLAALKRQRAREKAEAAEGRRPSASEVLDAEFDLSAPEFSLPEDIPDPFATPDDDEARDGTRDDSAAKDRKKQGGDPDDDASDGAKP
ncbi:MAG: type IV secretory system conjugative DNA transfer family protein [Pseudomonadota bacterium]|uniref:type IV secretory system conjugative DNA transfer family protein n=1 Tax=Qipengyuania flava TaxID=192812 RepID=UPI00273F6EEA|nr:type IV secretory system conjugative DNA transfer family protein [Qipengyuania flava]MEC7743596.1 type IV secretory system conjugative DNA transfer family protein [Pseudomonadota bacterium]